MPKSWYVPFPRIPFHLPVPERNVHTPGLSGMSTDSPKVFENNTGQCVGYARMMNGKRMAMGSCRWTDPDGDTFIGEFVQMHPIRR
jgi:hypothetical protein